MDFRNEPNTGESSSMVESYRMQHITTIDMTNEAAMRSDIPCHATTPLEKRFGSQEYTFIKRDRRCPGNDYNKSFAHNKERACLLTHWYLLNLSVPGMCVKHVTVTRKRRISSLDG